MCLCVCCLLFPVCVCVCVGALCVCAALLHAAWSFVCVCCPLFPVLWGSPVCCGVFRVSCSGWVCAVHYHCAWSIVYCVCTPLCCVCALPLCTVRSCALCHPRDRSCTAPPVTDRGALLRRGDRHGSPRLGPTYRGCSGVRDLPPGPWPCPSPPPLPLFGASAPLSSQGEREISEHVGWVSRVDQFLLQCRYN